MYVAISVPSGYEYGFSAGPNSYTHTCTCEKTRPKPVGIPIPLICTTSAIPYKYIISIQGACKRGGTK